MAMDGRELSTFLKMMVLNRSTTMPCSGKRCLVQAHALFRHTPCSAGSKVRTEGVKMMRDHQQQLNTTYAKIHKVAKVSNRIIMRWLGEKVYGEKFYDNELHYQRDEALSALMEHCAREHEEQALQLQLLQAKQEPGTVPVGRNEVIWVPDSDEEMNAEGIR